MNEFEVEAARAASEFDEGYEDERVLRGALFTEPLSRIPQRTLVTVPLTATVAEAIAAMNEAHHGCALVVREGRLVGIFTERDVLTKVAARSLSPKTPITEVMSTDPDTLPGNASIAYALRHMSVEGYRHIPLVDGEGRPTGVVGLRDIIHWMVTLFPQGVLNLPPAPGYPKAIDGG